jgi:hypothetical protein
VFFSFIWALGGVEVLIQKTEMGTIEFSFWDQDSDGNPERYSQSVDFGDRELADGVFTSFSELAAQLWVDSFSSETEEKCDKCGQYTVTISPV